MKSNTIKPVSALPPAQAYLPRIVLPRRQVTPPTSPRSPMKNNHQTIGDSASLDSRGTTPPSPPPAAPPPALGRGEIIRARCSVQGLASTISPGEIFEVVGSSRLRSTGQTEIVVRNSQSGAKCFLRFASCDHASWSAKFELV